MQVNGFCKKIGVMVSLLIHGNKKIFLPILINIFGYQLKFRHLARPNKNQKIGENKKEVLLHTLSMEREWDRNFLILTKLLKHNHIYDSVVIYLALLYFYGID